MDEALRMSHDGRVTNVILGQNRARKQFSLQVALPTADEREEGIFFDFNSQIAE
jgi:hypothetical protein